MELAILSTSWKLVRAITEIVDRLEQTREDARSLKYMETQATTFLTIVTDGLAGVDPAPYRETIASLELLYKDILTTSEKYILDGKIKQMWKASKTRRCILNLNRRIRLFIDTYLLQVATETARLNLRAFAEPPPPLPPISPSSEKAMWKVMSWSNGATTGNRTSIKPLTVVSDPMNPLLTPQHIQSTTRRMTAAAAEPSTGTSSTSSPNNLRVASTSTSSPLISDSEPRVPGPNTAGPTAEFIRYENVIGQQLSQTTSSSSPPPQTPTTLRRPGFNRRLLALEDCTPANNADKSWLDFKKGEILYTDGKRVSKFRTKYASYILVEAQNSDGRCGLVMAKSDIGGWMYVPSRHAITPLIKGICTVLKTLEFLDALAVEDFGGRVVSVFLQRRVGGGGLNSPSHLDLLDLFENVNNLELNRFSRP